MSKGPLLPINMPTIKPEATSVLPKGRLLVGLLLVTSVNLLAWTNPQVSSYYITNIHHKVSSWRSLPSFLGDVSLHPSLLSTVNLPETGRSEPPASYPWTPSGREEPVASEPGIDVPDTFDPTPYLIQEVAQKPARKMTGEPGMDVWSADENVFGMAGESEEELALIDWLRIVEALNVDLTDSEEDNLSPIDLNEIEKLLQEYAHAEGDATAVTGETLSAQLVQRLEWESAQDTEGE